MQTEVSLTLSNCPCKGYTEEQYISIIKNGIDLIINTKPHSGLQMSLEGSERHLGRSVH